MLQNGCNTPKTVPIGEVRAALKDFQSFPTFRCFKRVLRKKYLQFASYNDILIIKPTRWARRGREYFYERPENAGAGGLSVLRGREQQIALFRGAGRRAGAYFAKTYPDLTLELDAFVGQLQQKLVEMKIGVLRIESIDPDTGTIHLTVSEDADCSGLLHEADGRMYAQKEVHRQKFTPEISGAEA